MGKLAYAVCKKSNEKSPFGIVEKTIFKSTIIFWGVMTKCKNVLYKVLKR